jgi:hypothetical protein
MVVNFFKQINVYDNNFTLIIDIHFYETFSTQNSIKKRLHFIL